MSLEIPNKPVLVIGATGAIGQEVVRALLEKDAPVRVFVRSAEKVAALPARVERVVGVLEDESAVLRACVGVHAVFYVSPHVDTEKANAETIVKASRKEGVRVVFAGVHVDGGTRASRFVQRLMYGMLMPHYVAKMRLAERLRTACAESVLLLPGNYFQNDEICREQILAGTYPLPLRLFPRVDTRDVGDAAVRGLLDRSVRPGAYSLMGPESLSGEQTAASWSAALGREVRYQPDLEITDRLLEACYGGRKALDFQKTYRLAAKFAMKTTPGQVEQATSLLGRPLRTHAEYAREMAAKWTA